MMDDERLLRVLPPHTAAAWEAVAEIIPPAAYLIGGTCLAAHLGHRHSHDLDFCLESRVDLDALRKGLESRGSTVVDALIEEPLQTLNVYFSPAGRAGEATKIQFLDATRMHVLATPAWLEGLRLAGIPDLLAAKLRAVVGRTALRDYFDLMVIETDAHVMVEEGLGFYLERYRPDDRSQSLRFVIDALTSFRDLSADPALVDLRTGRSVGIDQIARYWRGRVPAIVAHLDRG